MAIVGRPNVGKSTLFNRMVRGRIAIVDDEPGVTRDRNYRETHWGGKRFFVVDTGGLIPGSRDTLEMLVRRHRGVRGVFCGHIHHVFEGNFAGIPLYSAPSASFQFVPESDEMKLDLRPPGFRVIQTEEMRFSTRVVRLAELAFAPRDLSC